MKYVAPFLRKQRSFTEVNREEIRRKYSPTGILGSQYLLNRRIEANNMKVAQLQFGSTVNQMLVKHSDGEEAAAKMAIAANRIGHHSMRNAAMWEKYGPIWIANLKANERYIRQATKQRVPHYLANECHVIACAGPGLDVVMDQLKVIKKERLATIWALDMSYIPLRKAGIMPDGMVSLDMDPVIEKMLKYPSPVHPVGFFSATSSPAAVRTWKGRKCFFAVSEMTDRLMQYCPEALALPTTQPGGTVSFTAMWIAGQIRDATGRGAKRIALVGNDLSYPECVRPDPDTGEPKVVAMQYCRNTYRSNAPDGRVYFDPNEIMPEDEGRPERIEMKMNVTRPAAFTQRDGQAKQVLTYKRYVYASGIMKFYSDVFAEFFSADSPIKYYNCTPSLLDLHHGSTRLQSAPIEHFMAIARKEKECRTSTH